VAACHTKNKLPSQTKRVPSRIHKTSFVMHRLPVLHVLKLQLKRTLLNSAPRGCPQDTWIQVRCLTAVVITWGSTRTEACDFRCSFVAEVTRGMLPSGQEVLLLTSQTLLMTYNSRQTHRTGKIEENKQGQETVTQTDEISLSISLWRGYKHRQAPLSLKTQHSIQTAISFTLWPSLFPGGRASWFHVSGPWTCLDAVLLQRLEPRPSKAYPATLLAYLLVCKERVNEKTMNVGRKGGNEERRE
jgi:hypothetical protein